MASDSSDSVQGVSFFFYSLVNGKMHNLEPQFRGPSSRAGYI